VPLDDNASDRARKVLMVRSIVVFAIAIAVAFIVEVGLPSVETHVLFPLGAV
jgi:hypothetical protein